MAWLLLLTWGRGGFAAVEDEKHGGGQDLEVRDSAGEETGGQQRAELDVAAGHVLGSAEAGVVAEAEPPGCVIGEGEAEVCSDGEVGAPVLD